MRLTTNHSETYYEERYLIIQRADNGSWLLDYAPGDPAQEICLGIFDTQSEALAARKNLLTTQYGWCREDPRR